LAEYRHAKADHHLHTTLKKPKPGQKASSVCIWSQWGSATRKRGRFNKVSCLFSLFVIDLFGLLFDVCWWLLVDHRFQ